MRFEVTVLGSNGAVPTPGRHASAHFFRSEGTDVLIDCGEGTQTQLLKAGFGFGRVSHIFITHLHGDHYFGLPGLITSLSLGGRTKSLTIVSPPGLEDRLSPILELHRYRPPFPLHFQEHTASGLDRIVELDDLEVHAFPLRHRIATNGYLIRERSRQPNIRKEAIEKYSIPWQAIPDIKAGGDYRTGEGILISHEQLTAPAAPPRSYGYCSDTIYFQEITRYVEGVDLLYHEATFLHDMALEARQKRHATAREAATVARDAGAGLLVIGHFSSRYTEVESHEREARAVFANSFAARDLYRFSVPYAGRKD